MICIRCRSDVPDGPVCPVCHAPQQPHPSFPPQGVGTPPAPVYPSYPPTSQPLQPPGPQLPLIPIEQLPPLVQPYLMFGETVHHFSFISSKGGCGSTNKAEQWLMVTNQRVVFEASVVVGGSVTNRNGSIPLDKVAHVSVASHQIPGGCGSTKSTTPLLSIGSAGGSIDVLVPTAPEAARIHYIINALISRQGGR